MIRADLQTRIRRVSAAMPADEFEDLIEQMAQVQLTFERRNRDAEREPEMRTALS